MSVYIALHTGGAPDFGEVAEFVDAARALGVKTDAAFAAHFRNDPSPRELTLVLDLKALIQKVGAYEAVVSQAPTQRPGGAS